MNAAVFTLMRSKIVQNSFFHFQYYYTVSQNTKHKNVLHLIFFSLLFNKHIYMLHVYQNQYLLSANYRQEYNDKRNQEERCYI